MTERTTLQRRMLYLAVSLMSCAAVAFLILLIASWLREAPVGSDPPVSDPVWSRDGRQASYRELETEHAYCVVYRYINNGVAISCVPKEVER